MILGPYSECLRYYLLEADRSSLTTRLLKAPSAQLPTYGDHRALVGEVAGLVIGVDGHLDTNNLFG